MPHTPGSLVARAAAVIGLSLVSVLPAAAQTPTPNPNPPKTPQFMARYDFHLSAVGLTSSDPRFTWDTHWGGDVDLLDYVSGRAEVLVDYEAMIGSQLRAFDPNQGNYTLEASASGRFHGTEIAGVFHHVSRHLSDRPKLFAIAWNVAEARLLRQFSAGRSRIDVVAEAGRVTERAFVDYTWTASADVRLDRPLNPHVGLFAHASGESFGVTRSGAGSRGTQTGGLVEAGIRLPGPAGALELYGGFEKRIDADQIERVPEHWAFAGFRLVNR
jgi:hypothetical protein